MVGRRAHWHAHGPAGRGMRAARCRWWSDDAAGWMVNGRVERFVEPALLLLLRDEPSHGDDLAEAMAELAPDDRVDLGNLYRLLRDLEAEGLVRSSWAKGGPGRAKRTYELTDEGEAVLDAWAAGLTRTRKTIDRFLKRHAGRRG